MKQIKTGLVALLKLLDNKYSAAFVMLFMAVSFSLYAVNNVDRVELAQEENIDYRMEQEHLQEKNDGLRAKLEAQEADVKKTKDQIAENKAKWHEFNGMIKKNQNFIDAYEALGKTQQ